MTPSRPCPDVVGIGKSLLSFRHEGDLEAGSAQVWALARAHEAEAVVRQIKGRQMAQVVEQAPCDLARASGPTHHDVLPQVREDVTARIRRRAETGVVCGDGGGG